MPDSDETLAFSALLRQQRLAAGLTQGVLAERAGVAARTIQDLERGIAQPRRETVRRLVAVLAPPPEIRAQIEAASSSPRDRDGRPGHVASVDPASHRLAPAPDQMTDQSGWTSSQASLPVALTSLVGREHELAAIAGQLTKTRLLTLTGVGGVGKTRLAIEAARAAQADYADSVRLVELAALADPVLVPQTVAKVLGIAEQPGRPLIETVIGVLQSRQILLVLDNCEHLLDGCAALVQQLLTACDGLRVLATSREPLGVESEVVWRVPSLSVPASDVASTPDGDLAEYGAVRLFVDRARLVQPSFALTEESTPAVIDICRRVDGIPLAVELAAARVPFLTVRQIAARLDDQLGLLTHGRRTAVPRHRTLQATLDWSHNLLAEPERALLRRLAVFAGGWTLEAVEAVCCGDGLDRAEILDLLSRLVDASLVIVEERAGEARYRLLEPVRQYAFERLRATTEEAAARDRHAAWCLTLTEGADPALWPSLRPGWREWLRVERDNLRAALAWCLDHDPPTGLRLASQLGWWWYVESSLEEGRHWLEACLSRCPGETPDHVRALLGLGRFPLMQGDRSTARALSERTLALARKIGDLFGQTEALRGLGNLLADIGAVEEARAHLEEGLTLVRELGNRRGIAGNLGWLGNLDLAEGEYDRARTRYEESLEIARTLEDPWLLATLLTYLGAVATGQGEYRHARARFEEATAVMNVHETPSLLGFLTWWKAHLAYCQSDLTQAASLYEEAVAIGRRYGGRGMIASALFGLARVTLARGDPTGAAARAEEALRLLDPADDVRRSSALYVQGLAVAQQGDHARGEALVCESLTLRAKAGRRALVAECLEALAQIAAQMERAARSTRLLGAADALRSLIGAPVPPVGRAAIEAATDAARTSLGADAFAETWADGQTLSFERAVAYALDVPS